MTSFPQKFTDQLIQDTGIWSKQSDNPNVINLCEYSTSPSVGSDVVFSLKLKGLETLYLSAHYLPLALKALAYPDDAVQSWLKPIVNQMKEFSGKEHALLMINFNNGSAEQKDAAAIFLENPKIEGFDWTMLTRSALAPSSDMNALYARFKERAKVRDFTSSGQELEDRLDRLRFKKRN